MDVMVVDNKANVDIEPASKSQTYYLFMLTGLDSRNCNLSKKECFELIALWKGSKREDQEFVYDFLITKNAVVRRKKSFPKNNTKKVAIMNKFSRKETYERIDGLVNAKKSWDYIVKILNKEGHATNRISVGKWTIKGSYDFYRRTLPERPTGVRKVQQERRLEMCELLNSGKTIKEIAAQFNICDVAVRSAIKTALRKNEAVVDAKYSFGKNAKRSRSKNKNKKVLTQKTVLKPSFPAFAISEMKSVLDSILDSNMDNSSKLAIIKTVLGQK